MSEGYIIGGGSGSGGTLTVTGVAGSTVTVSKDGKIRTRTLGSNGKATFKGLTSGTWTVTMTNGAQTATRTVEITADYSAIITYFAATIHATYPVGARCYAQLGTKILTAPDRSGTWDCVVDAPGAWIVSYDDWNNTTDSQTATITQSGTTVNVSLLYYLWDHGSPSRRIAWSSEGYNQREGSPSGGGVLEENTFMAQGAAGQYEGAIGTVAAIDLTNFNTLLFSAGTTNQSNAVCFITTKKTYFEPNAVASYSPIPTDGTARTIDVSKLSGSYYIVFTASSGGNGLTRVFGIYLQR